MKIEHIAIWTKDIEKMRSFYMNYFNMECSDIYHNPTKKFTSYFLSFKNSKTRIELMHNPEIATMKDDTFLGFTHIAISVENKENVNTLTEQIRSDGFQVVGEARTTGDRYYESVILDCEENRIEITE